LTSRTLRYLIAAVGMGILFFVCCTQADAQSPFWRPRPAPPPYSFSVEDDNGNSLPTFVKNGRTFLLAEPGQRYNIRVRNPTAGRVEAVVSVDGRDAVSGHPGDYVKERGYVINAYDSLLVQGFRQSFTAVAAFRFTSPENSYSARMGTPQNVGVIGVAFFPERVRPTLPLIRRPEPRAVPEPRIYDNYAPSMGAANEPSSPMKPKLAPRAEARGDSAARAPDVVHGDDRGGRLNNLGTEYGETEQSAVTSVSFERASATHPVLLLTLRYDDAEGLTARGIDVYGDGARRVRSDDPQAFPLSRFAAPPP